MGEGGSREVMAEVICRWEIMGERSVRARSYNALNARGRNCEFRLFLESSKEPESSWKSL